MSPYSIFDIPHTTQKKKMKMKAVALE
jgi:hypothetical protein